MTDKIWMDFSRCESPEERKSAAETAAASGITRAIVRPEDEWFSELGFSRLIFSDGKELSGGYARATVASPEDLERAASLIGTAKGIVLCTKDWKVIPVENLIASCEKTGTELLVRVSDAEEAELCLGILEKGADGIVVGPGFDASALKTREIRHGLSEVAVTRVTNIGTGDRVCVDTVVCMNPGEGMLVGSQAACLFLVQCECEDGGYVAPRPFRVNAGAVHAYAMDSDGRTRYLSEYRSGDSVTIVGRDGKTTESRVGRCKIEKRPLMLVGATDGKNEYSTILQNAETVRLVTKDGSVSVSDLKPGDRVLARIGSAGRHFGMEVDETVREIR